MFRTQEFHLILYRDKRFIITLLLTLTIAAIFWTGQRYPSLNEKAMMGGDIVIEDPLGFRPFLAIDPSALFWKRVLITTVNWVHTNRHGMTFGLLMAAALTCLLPLLIHRLQSSRVGNSALGVAIGAPLGVCVNCAAPIARGLHASGAAMETTLATMISSPTMNIIVLTMLFSLFPLHLAVGRILLILIFLLILLPLVLHWMPANWIRVKKNPSSGKRSPEFPPLEVEGTQNTWPSAFLWTGRSYLRGLWFIVRYTVPTMLLAGFLGALIVTLLPWEDIAAKIPIKQVGIYGIFIMAGLSLFGLSLPVPMAFDVVICAILLANGVPQPYVMVLLLTLGSYSVYSFFVLWEAISFRMALLMAGLLFGVGLAGGVGAELYRRWDEPRQFAVIKKSFSEMQAIPRTRQSLPKGEDASTLISALSLQSLRWQPFENSHQSGILVSRSDLFARSGDKALSFKRNYGEAIGLPRIDSLPPAYKLIAPYYRNFPIAAGDVHQDGWIDVVFGTDTGIFLYANLQGKRFQLQQIDAPLQEFYAGNLALVDLNSDGWVDLFFSAYRKGAFVIYNDQGKFDSTKMEKLPGPHANFANAAAFGDIDRDGDLDIVIGNWTAGPFTPVPPDDSRNFILWRENGSFRPEEMKDRPGETLSLLLSDIDGDNDLDLLTGNDFAVPDFIYEGDGRGRFLEISKDKIPHTTTTTMSIDSGDWDNDLKPELYFTQVASTRGLAIEPADSEVCVEHSDSTWRKRCESVMNLYTPQRRAYTGRTPKPCADIADPTGRADCLAYYMLMHAYNKKDRSLCDAFPQRWSDLAFICKESFRRKRIPKDQLQMGITQIPGKNVFLVPSGLNYEDKAASLGISSG